MGLKMTKEQAARVGWWLREARELREFTQDTLATTAEVSRETVGQLERAKVGPQGPDYSKVHAIEAALRVPKGTIRRVVEGEDVPTDPAEMTETDEGTEALRQLDELRQEIHSSAKNIESLTRRVASLERRPGRQGR